jgi:prepilin-type N-terminal cleavage/methylation domain-containing protein
MLYQPLSINGRTWFVRKQMKIRRNLPNAKAFTIVEVLISVVIVGISAAGLMGCFRFAWFAIRMARENQRATQIILERAEAIRCYSWDNLPNVPNLTRDYYNRTTQEQPVYRIHTVLTSWSSVPPSGTAPSYASKMQTLTIYCTWASGPVTRTRTYTTYIAQDGIQNYVF